MPVFQVSTRSRNGVKCTIPRLARSNQNSSHSFAAWSAAPAMSAAIRPRRVSGPWKYCTSLRRLRHRVPFAQRLRVARAHVGVLRIGAHGGEDLPRARAFPPLGRTRHDRDTADIGKTKSLDRLVALDQLPT